MSLCVSVGTSGVMAVSPVTLGVMGASLSAGDRAEPGASDNTPGALCPSPSPPPTGSSKVAGLSTAWPWRREGSPGFPTVPDTVGLSRGRLDEPTVLNSPFTASPVSPCTKAEGLSLTVGACSPTGSGVTSMALLTAPSCWVVSSPPVPGLGLKELALASLWVSTGRVMPSSTAPVAAVSPWLSSSVTPAPTGLPAVGCAAQETASGGVVGRDTALAVGSRSAPSLVTAARMSSFTSAKRGVDPRAASGASPVTSSSASGVTAGCCAEMAAVVVAAVGAAEPLSIS